MQSKNICKFVTVANQDRLDVSRFIYESDADTMKMTHRLDTHRVMLISAGCGTADIDKKDWDFTVGSLIFAFSGEEITIKAECECEFMYIDFEGARAESLFGRFGINRVARVQNGFDGLIPLWHDSLRRASEMNLDLAAEGVLLYTFSRLLKDADEKNKLISRILEITEENFTDSTLSVSTIAEELSYNAKYISHTFKEKMDVSYSEYLRTLRVKYAVSLLEYGIDSVKNIAFLSGFTDPMYFSTVFKKMIGVSPKEYMNRPEKVQEEKL